MTAALPGIDPLSAAEPAPGAASATPQAQPPELPIDLDQDPFGSEEVGEGEQVAGLGAVLRPLFKKILGKKGAEEGVEQTLREGAEAESRELVPRDPDLEGKHLGPEMEVKTGTTRDLPNAQYYESQYTQDILDLLKEEAQIPVVLTHAQTLEAAAQRETLESLTGKKPSLNWNPAELTALRQSLEGQGEELGKFNAELMAKRTQGHTVSTEELAQFELMTRRLVATQNAVAGLSTEAGRMLNVLKIQADTPGAYYREIAKVVAEGGGPEVIGEKMAAVAAARTPRQVQEAAHQGFAARTWAMVLKVRYNLMLSSIRTHGANIAGSTASGIYETAIVDPLSYINNMLERAGRKALGGPFTRADDIVALPMGSEMRGLIKGAYEGLGLAYQIARGTVNPLTAGRPGVSGGGKFVNEMGIRYKPGEAPKSVLGKIGNAPTRLLEAEDAFFRSAYFNKRLHGLALSRAAAESGGDAAVKKTLLQQYLNEPPEDMVLQAAEYAKKLTYTNDPNVYGKFVGSLAKAAQKLTDYGPFKLLIPFTRTPANLLGYTLEQSFAGPIVAPSRTRKAIMGNDARARADAIARIEVAVGTVMLLEEFVADGSITGMGSANYGTVKTMEANGWRQNSICGDETCYQLNRLDPLGSTMGMVATLHELMNEQNLSPSDRTAVIGTTLLALADQQLDRSYLSSLGQFMSAIQRGSGGIKSVTSLVASTGTSMLVPNLARDFREMSDDTVREQAFDPKDQGFGLVRWQKNLMNALPVASRWLPPAIDWKGEVITNDGHFLVRGLLPIKLGNKRQGDQFDVATAELLRNGITPNKPKTSFVVPKTGGTFEVSLLSLDDGAGDIYAYYQSVIGQARHKAVSKLIDSKDYREAVREGLAGTPESKVGRALRSTMDKATRIAKGRFLEDLTEGRTVKRWDGEKLKLPQVSIPALKAALKDLKEGKEPDAPFGMRHRRKAMPGTPDWLLGQEPGGPNEGVKPRF